MEFDRSWDALLNLGAGRDYFALADRRPFANDSADYHAVNAWWLAEMSRLVYRDGDGPSRSEVLSRVGLAETAFYDVRGTQCMLVESPGGELAVLAFRGSSTLEDWLRNLNVSLEDWPGGGRVHEGFREAADEVWQKVAARLASVTGPLFITGHSLGGALAVLAAARCPRAVQGVYTFGAPRLGDPAFIETLASIPIFRVVHGFDIVPTVPPSLGDYRFCHAGQLHRLGTNDDAICRNEQPDSIVDLLTIVQRLSEAAMYRGWQEPPDYLSDHAPVNYVTATERELLECPYDGDRS